MSVFLSIFLFVVKRKFDMLSITGFTRKGGKIVSGPSYTSCDCAVVCSLQVDPSLKLVSPWNVFPWSLLLVCVQFILPVVIHYCCKCNKTSRK